MGDVFIGIGIGLILGFTVVAVNMPLTINEDRCVEAGLIVFNDNTCMSEEDAQAAFSGLIKRK